LPLIYQKPNLTIDGYTQPGASPNSNPITAANNAVLKIVIDGRNGNGRMMDASMYDGTLATSDPPIDNTSMASERTGYGSSEWGLLGVYRSTNVTIKGLAFLGDDLTTGNSIYCIAFEHDYGLNTEVLDRLDYVAGSEQNGHVAGCWFGVNPTNPTPAGVVKTASGIAFFRHRDVSGGTRPELPNVGLMVGVAPGSANPRAEFNVFAGVGYSLAGEAIRTRVSGNFFGVLPDGVTPYDLSLIDPTFFSDVQCQFEIGRYSDTNAIVIGTDGDGVNDADEGNLFGPVGDNLGNKAVSLYGTSDKPYIIAGNTFGIGVDGKRWTNAAYFVDGLSTGAGTHAQIGSDFDGVSDSLEANKVYNNWPLSLFGTPLYGDLHFISVDSSAATNGWVSVRGNVMVNNGLTPYNYADPNGPAGRVDGFTNYYSTFMDTNGSIIPAIASGSTVANLIGTCATTNGSPFTNIIIDVYVLDPEGWTNGMAFALPDLIVTNGTVVTTNGFPQGKQYLGSFVDNGPLDRDPAVASFNFNIASLGIPVGTQITITANYSADPAGTRHGRTHTSNFSNPLALPEGLKVASVTRSGNILTFTWTGGNAPYTLQKKTTINGAWSDVATGITGNSTTDTITGSEGYYRITGN
jgi:hypothetical protein